MTIPIHKSAPSPDGPSDEVLVRALDEGTQHAFDVLVARHGARVRTYLGHLVSDPALAEDLTQDVFVKLLTHTHAPMPGGPVVWLLHVARNLGLDHMRHRRVRERWLAGVRDGVTRWFRRAPERPEEALAQDELNRALTHELAQLPEVQRSVFVLREVEGLSYEAIGEVLDCSPKTVSTRLHRARVALRAALAEHAPADERGGVG